MGWMVRRYRFWNHKKKEHVGIEFWENAIPEGRYFKGKYEYNDSHPDVMSRENQERLHLNNTNKALRLIGTSYSLYYSVWCTNEQELYNLKVSHLHVSRTVSSKSTVG